MVYETAFRFTAQAQHDTTKKPIACSVKKPRAKSLWIRAFTKRMGCKCN